MEEKYEQIEFNSEAALDGAERETAEPTDTAKAEESVTDVAENGENGEVNASEKEQETVTESAEPETENGEKSDTASGEGAESETAAPEEATAEEKTEGAAEKTEGEEKKSSRRRAAKDTSEQSDGTEAAIAPEKLSKTEAMRVLEAIMFANGDEVYYDQFAKIIGYTTKEAIKIVDAYAKMYDSGSMPRGIRFVRYEKCCQLTTAPDLGEYVTQMIGIRGEPQLSAAAMETLAIVAYNQPVTRAYIEQVRRVDSTRPIAVLLDRELIEEKGRLEVIGRPRLFGTTQNFLKTFGITSLEALPSLDLFAVEG